MNYQKVSNSQYVLRLARGENIVESLQKFCQDQQIDGAFFTGIGATDQVELAHYNVQSQKYSTKKFDQALEVTNLSGNISFYQSEPIIHAHITLSDTEMKSLGGHLVEARVSGTLEILITKSQPLTKMIDTQTGLKVFDLPNQLS